MKKKEENKEETLTEKKIVSARSEVPGKCGTCNS